MRNLANDAEQMAIKRAAFLEEAYRLFCEKTIAPVSLQDIADSAGYGIATLYRYFVNKPSLVVEVAARKWGQYLEENLNRRPDPEFNGMTAAQVFSYYLDSFLELYRNRRDLLRFNQFFNVYIQSEQIDPEAMKPYMRIMEDLRQRFHIIYLKAQEDHTIRTDEPEEQMFSKTLHLMLAAVTRYAVGLVYIPESGFDPMNELEFQKNAIWRAYLSEEAL